jgi:thioredoxin-dependent peroxiredoxin
VRDAVLHLRRKNVAVVGISPDSRAVLREFEQKEGLNFPLLSVANHSLAQRYGVWEERSMYGKKFLGVTRSLFLVDEEGKVLDVWCKLAPGDTVPKALEAVSGRFRFKPMTDHLADR